MWESHDRYPKRHQLSTFDALLHEIDFRLSLLPSDGWLAEWARYTSGYTIRLWPERPGVRVLLDAPPDPAEPDPSDPYESITPEIELRSTLAVAQGLLGYELARVRHQSATSSRTSRLILCSRRCISLGSPLSLSHLLDRCMNRSTPSPLHSNPT